MLRRATNDTTFCHSGRPWHVVGRNQPGPRLRLLYEPGGPIRGGGDDWRPAVDALEQMTFAEEAFVAQGAADPCTKNGN